MPESVFTVRTAKLYVVFKKNHFEYLTTPYSRVPVLGYRSQNSMGKKDAELFRPRQYNNFNRQYLMEGNVEFSRVSLSTSILTKVSNCADDMVNNELCIPV